MVPVGISWGDGPMPVSANTGSQLYMAVQQARKEPRTLVGGFISTPGLDALNATRTSWHIVIVIVIVIQARLVSSEGGKVCFKRA